MSDRLFTPRFVVLTVAGFFYFTALGTQFPILPTYVEDNLGGGSVAVGLAVGAFGLSSAALRPLVGAMGDRRGRRFLIMSGGFVAGLSIAATVFAESVGAVVFFRLLTGVGEAALFVGVAAGIQDQAPPQRRGEAASYFSTAVYGGLAVGPILGELVFEEVGVDEAFLFAGAMAIVAALLGWWAPGPPEGPTPPRPATYLHRGALRPGLVLGINLLAYAGFLSFIALHAEDVGIARAGGLLALFAAIVLAVRLLAAPLPDRLGPLLTSRLGLILGASGFFIIGLWEEPAGVYLGTSVFAVGQAFMFPALFVVVVDSAREDERSHAIGTFSFFFDIAIGLGGLVLGAVVALTDRPTAFLVGGLICLLDLALLERILGPAMAATRPVEAPIEETPAG